MCRLRQSAATCLHLSSTRTYSSTRALCCTLTRAALTAPPPRLQLPHPVGTEDHITCPLFEAGLTKHSTAPTHAHTGTSHTSSTTAVSEHCYHPLSNTVSSWGTGCSGECNALHAAQGKPQHQNTQQLTRTVLQSNNRDRTSCFG